MHPKRKKRLIGVAVITAATMLLLPALFDLAND